MRLRHIRRRRGYHLGSKISGRTAGSCGRRTGLEPSRADLDDTKSLSFPPATQEVTVAPYRLYPQLDREPLNIVELTESRRSIPDVMSVVAVCRARWNGSRKRG